MKAKICVDSWAGKREFPCEIMRETKTKYVCRMLGDQYWPRKHVRLGDVVKGPKRAVRIETPDHEREISRQDKTQEESALPQGRGESLIAQLDRAVTHGGVNLREGALAGHSTKSAWLDSRQKSARSMGAASCATNNADRAALTQGGGGDV